jgi:organic hydroperoxide reductase OsmC/OhrA
MGAGHRYEVTVRWTGDDGLGTRDYKAYRRDHLVRVEGKPDLAGSSDPAFRGDRSRHNPEELLVAALSACHMLAYLHLAAVSGIGVREYEDRAEGTMVTNPEGGGRFTDVVLRPRVVLDAGDPDQARSLHEDAHHRCFIASSVNFPVRCEPTVVVAGRPSPA